MAINFDYNFPQLARDAGFKLRQYKDGPLDWRLIGCLEIERIMRDQSLEQIDSILSHLSEAPLGSILDTNILDSGIAKYFILSQFSIQYLLFCRKFLDETVRDLRESLVESQMEVGRLKKSLAESNNEILQLNKKITQIEAIHEVVYPCHLCSKNFVSNEALNIHIGRKHTNGGNRSRRNEMPQSAAQREKDNDRNLINTIKLELEIKQLKERLNVAEKDIRERSAANSLRASPHVPSAPEKVTKNVAIQSNLMESKEKDDTISEEDASGSPDAAELRERKEQLLQLQEKIKEFEEWRDLQKVSSEESLGAINKKLAELAKSLEASKQKREEVNELRQAMHTNMQRRMSPSVDDLEKLLTEKVAEIGKASAEKLEEVVFHMEQNYKEKLEELEKEIKRKNEATSKITVVQERTTNDGAERDTLANLAKEAPKDKRKDETYIVEEFNGIEKTSSQIQEKENKPAHAAKQVLPKEIKESVSSESNRTFVKERQLGVILQETTKIPQPNFGEHPDSTDISETLSEEETNEEETSTEESDLKPKAREVLKQQKSLEDHSKTKTEENVTKKENSKLQNQKRIQAAAKKYTRKDAKKLVSRRLSTLGYELSSKSISTSNMNKVNAELTERRNKLRQKYPNFMATRNRIKKFVDKLCSKRLPENAEDMLRNTKPQQPLGELKPKPKRLHALSTDESFEALEPNASTPVRETKTTDAFKQRLERLLSSPMRKPESYTPTTSKADVHTAPVPLPRKRVMFNTLSDTKESDDSDVQDDSDGESSGVTHISSLTKERKDRKTLESSIGSLL